MDSVASHLVSVGNNAFQQEETKVFSFFLYMFCSETHLHLRPVSRFDYRIQTCWKLFLMSVMYTTSVVVKVEP